MNRKILILHYLFVGVTLFINNTFLFCPADQDKINDAIQTLKANADSLNQQLQTMNQALAELRNFVDQDQYQSNQAQTVTTQSQTMKMDSNDTDTQPPLRRVNSAPVLRTKNIIVGRLDPVP